MSDMKIALAVVSFALSFVCCADSVMPGQWVAKIKVDEITDATNCYLSVFGDEVNAGYCPALNVRLGIVGVDNGRMKFNVDVFFWMYGDRLRGKSIDAVMRIGKSESVAGVWSVTRDRHGAFAPNPAAVLAEMVKADSLAVRFALPNGEERTLSYSLKGLPGKLDEVKRRFVQAPPKKAIVQKAICKKCGGKGFVEAWDKCPDCGGVGSCYNGTVTVRCKRCGNSIKRGMVRMKQDCESCKGKQKTRGGGLTADAMRIKRMQIWADVINDSLSVGRRAPEDPKSPGGEYIGLAEW